MARLLLNGNGNLSPGQTTVNAVQGKSSERVQNLHSFMQNFRFEVRSKEKPGAPSPTPFKRRSEVRVEGVVKKIGDGSWRGAFVRSLVNLSPPEPSLPQRPELPRSELRTKLQLKEIENTANQESLGSDFLKEAREFSGSLHTHLLWSEVAFFDYSKYVPLMLAKAIHSSAGDAQIYKQLSFEIAALLIADPERVKDLFALGVKDLHKLQSPDYADVMAVLGTAFRLASDFGVDIRTLYEQYPSLDSGVNWNDGTRNIIRLAGFYQDQTWIEPFVEKFESEVSGNPQEPWYLDTQMALLDAIEAVNYTDDLIREKTKTRLSEDAEKLDGSMHQLIRARLVEVIKSLEQKKVRSGLTPEFIHEFEKFTQNTKAKDLKVLKILGDISEIFKSKPKIFNENQWQIVNEEYFPKILQREDPVDEPSVWDEYGTKINSVKMKSAFEQVRVDYDLGWQRVLGSVARSEMRTATLKNAAEIPERTVNEIGDGSGRDTFVRSLADLSQQELFPVAKTELPRSEVRSGEISPMDLNEAYGFLRGMIEKRILTDQQQTLDIGRALAEETVKFPINKIAVVGRGSRFFPLLMALTGREILFIDKDLIAVKKFELDINKIRDELAAQGKSITLQVKTISDSIQNLDLVARGITPGTFDMVTLIDMIGAIPQGDPNEWLLKARELLKPEGYLFLDWDEAIQRLKGLRDYFFTVFPNFQMLADGQFFLGDYNIPFGPTNRIFHVAVSRSEVRSLRPVAESDVLTPALKTRLEFTGYIFPFKWILKFGKDAFIKALTTLGLLTDKKTQVYSASEIQAAKKFLGIRTGTQIPDAFILGSDLALNNGGLILIDTFLKGSGVAIVADSKEAEQRLATYNKERTAQGKKSVMIVKTIAEAEKVLSGRSELRVNLYGFASPDEISEEWAEFLRGKVQVFNARRMEVFAETFGVSSLLESFKARFSFAKSA